MSDYRKQIDSTPELGCWYDSKYLGGKYEGNLCPCIVVEDAIPPGGFKLEHVYTINTLGQFVEVDT